MNSVKSSVNYKSSIIQIVNYKTSVTKHQLQTQVLHIFRPPPAASVPQRNLGLATTRNFVTAAPSFSPSNKYVAVATPGAILCWNLQAGKLEATTPLETASNGTNTQSNVSNTQSNAQPALSPAVSESGLGAFNASASSGNTAGAPVSCMNWTLPMLVSGHEHGLMKLWV
jgi:hypothetical protein